MLEPNVTELDPGETWCALDGHGLQFMVNPETGKRVQCVLWGKTFQAGSEKWKTIFYMVGHNGERDPRALAVRAAETGICEECHREMQSGDFATCAIHGIQPGEGACPVCAAGEAAVADAVREMDAEGDDVGESLPEVGVGELDAVEPHALAEPTAEGSGGDGDRDRSADAGVPDGAGDRGGDSADGPPSADPAAQARGAAPAAFSTAELRSMRSSWAQSFDLSSGDFSDDGPAGGEGEAPAAAAEVE